MFDCMEIAEYIYKGLVEPSYKNLPEQTPIVIITAGEREDNSPRHGLAPRSVRSLASEEKDM